MRGHIISPSIEHTLAAKLPPALWCLVVRHQAPLHSMLPLASKDVLHFSTPKKNQLLRCGISISTYLILLKFIAFIFSPLLIAPSHQSRPLDLLLQPPPNFHSMISFDLSDTWLSPSQGFSFSTTTFSLGSIRASSFARKSGLLKKK